MTVFDEAKGFDPMRMERERINSARWENYGRGLGLQTDEIRKRALFPQWAWDDYAI